MSRGRFFSRHGLNLASVSAVEPFGVRACVRGGRDPRVELMIAVRNGRVSLADDCEKDVGRMGSRAGRVVAWVEVESHPCGTIQD